MNTWTKDLHRTARNAAQDYKDAHEVMLTPSETAPWITLGQLLDGALDEIERLHHRAANFAVADEQMSAWLQANVPPAHLERALETLPRRNQPQPPSDAAVERAARAFYEGNNPRPKGTRWATLCELAPSVSDHYRQMMRHALKAAQEEGDES